MLKTDHIDAEIALLEAKKTRKNARQFFRSWCQLIGHQPAKHHDLIIQKCQEVTESPTPRYVILLFPPGSAKSTYTSSDFPPWYLGKRPGSCILACSYAATLAESFGRRGRNYVDQYSTELGYALKSDSKAAGEWETTNGGRYFCAGVGTGIAGHRADLGLIDDPLGSQEDADSKLMRDKQWEWFLGDFWPRLKPNASIIIIANRRHEDDLIGRLIDPANASFSPIPPSKWEVLRIPFFAEEGDPLGRQIGERLWPEWFTEDMAEGVRLLPARTRSGLYDQNPAPEEGDYFKREWLIGYTRDDYDKLMQEESLRVYGAADFAVSEEKDANRTCIGGGALSSNRLLYILPDLFWKIAGPKEVIAAYTSFLERRSPQTFVAEKGHISKAWGPFFEESMLDQGIYAYIKEVTPSRAKDVRARSFQGLCAMGRVRFPKFCSWWSAAEHEMLTFPGGKTDDFVDFLAHLGMEVSLMLRSTVIQKPVEKSNAMTFKWLKGCEDRKKREKLAEVANG